MNLHPQPLSRLVERIPESGPCDPELSRAIDFANSAKYADLIYDAGEFQDLPLPEKRQIIEPWLSEAIIAMIYGPAGIGKTMFAMGVADSITTGRPLGSWSVNAPATCLYLDGEMAPQDIQKRLAGFSNGRRLSPLLIYSDALMNSYGLPRANLLNEDWRQAMKELLLDYEVKVWVVDNIASLAPCYEENAKDQWDPINQWFLELRFAGITTIFLHHANKDGGQRGTSGRTDNVDIVISLEKPARYSPEDGAKFVIKFQKHRIEQKYLPLIADTEFALETDEAGHYFWTYGSLKRRTKAQVLKMFSEGLAANDIAEELKLSKSRVSQIKTAAVGEGLMTKDGKLTQSGFEWLQKN
jgi:putative DNA primase/helicase